ncbi:MAG: hypothetical protein KAT15_07395 [Bacteroidales bacterium]|nr:hypothetical protein [Bacteroidales bacterium]
MKKLVHLLLISALISGTIACDSGSKKGSEDEEKPAMVRKKRDDGTLSSINPVDEEGYVHGVKVNFYEDGKTIHSKVTYVHGRKNGPAIWYFKDGNIHERTNFFQNRRHGITKKYYKSGVLMEEVNYNTGEELPGKKTYNEKGELVSH